MSGVQRDGDRHDGARSQSPTVHPGQAEAVEEAEALHLTATAGVAVLDAVTLHGCQQ